MEQLINQITNLFSWSYSEREGEHATRFDFSVKGEDLSLWFYHAGSCEGHAPKSIKQKLASLADTEFVKFV